MYRVLVEKVVYVSCIKKKKENSKKKSNIGSSYSNQNQFKQGFNDFQPLYAFFYLRNVIHTS